MARAMQRAHVAPIAWLAVALATAPACSCEGCVYRAPDCSLHLSCDTDAATRPHSSWAPRLLNTCGLTCDWGWSDCDRDELNGCETRGLCAPPADAGPDASGAPPKKLATLAGEPGGLALCGDEVVYVDGASIHAVPIAGGAPRLVASFDASVVSGLVCDTDSVWVGLGASTAGAADGALVRASLGDGGAVTVALGIEPGRGIDRDDAGVHWLSRSTGGDAGGALVMRTVEDAGTTPSMPADERADLYKTFALRDGVWTAAGGDLLHERDGSVEALEAGALAVAARASDVVALTTGSDGGAELRAHADGGLGAPVALVERPRVLAAWKNVVFVATDDAIVMVPSNGPAVVLVTGLPHVIDLVADATGVYFTTAAPQAGVWSMPWW